MLAAKIDQGVAPLSTDETGTIRVGKTRVRLDSVVYAFNQGHTPEEILMQFPSLDLADIYSVIAYYLNNQTAVDEYIRQNEAKADEIRRKIESQPGYTEFRERLLARKEAILREREGKDST